MPKVEFVKNKDEIREPPPTKVWPVILNDSIRIMASNPSVGGGDYCLCDIGSTGIHTYKYVPASLGIALKDGKIVVVEADCLVP